MKILCCLFHLQVIVDGGGGGSRGGIADQIRALNALRDDGILTDAEFDSKKKQLLGFGDDVSVGSRVAVKGKGTGVVRFVGRHAENGQPRIGVELDDPVGKNNGTVKVCGVLCPLYARRRSLVVLSCPGCLG